MKIKRIIFVLIFLLLLSGTVFALDIDGIHVSAGKAVILNAEPVADSPAPAAAASLFGVSVPMNISEKLYFEPGLRFYNHWVVLDSDYKPVLAAEETANRVSVLDCELRPEIGTVFELTDKIRIGVTGAPVFTFRFPINGYDAADGDDKTIVRKYYFSKLRFFGIYAGGFFSWDFAENNSLNFKVGTNLPVYHLWDSEDISFYDQLIIEPEIGIVFHF